MSTNNTPLPEIGELDEMQTFVNSNRKSDRSVLPSTTNNRDLGFTEGDPGAGGSIALGAREDLGLLQLAK
ncbi:hypothetical protein [Rubidibacter lacunae]|uniref:hypothetical protein n=1 Tax=Rubidibacter lacunae TaxID=582514 RepID=UPI0012EBCA1F|nr:hypothetical protein [Rubidibacter lacunae]